MMMKYSIPIFLLIASVAFGQGVNIDKEAISVSYMQLPQKPILEVENRTFSTNIQGLTINGFRRTEDNPTLIIEYSRNETLMENRGVSKVKREKKDKEGNVISSYYDYYANATYTTSASLYISNTITGTSDHSEFNEESDYKSDAFRSESAAKSHFRNSKYNFLSKYRNSHKKALLERAKWQPIVNYAYRPQIEKYDYLWILGKKKHPEYKDHQDAYQKAAEVFKQMSTSEPTDKIAEGLTPIMEYFESLISKYPGKKKKMRKMRYASLYNIATMYYYLDNHEKVAEYGQKIIDNDYSKSSGKQFIRYAESLKNTLEINQVTSRHMVIEAPAVK